jgi:hypothetical protein
MFRNPAVAACAAFAAFFLCARQPVRAEAFRLKDGTILIGEVVGRSDSGIVVHTVHLGDLRFDPGDLSCTGEAAFAAASCSSERVMGDPEDHSLFFLPTAFTPPRNSAHFKDLELYFLNLGYSPTAATQFTLGFLFPITLQSQFLTASLKQRVIQWDRDSSRTAIAAEGSLSKPVGDDISSFGESYSAALVLSHRAMTTVGPYADGFGAHALIGYTWKEGYRREFYFSPERSKWTSQLSLGAGMEIRGTRHVKLMAEYMNSTPFNIFNDDDEIDGMITVGLRIHGAKLSADIAGVRPLTDNDLGDFFAFPLLTISYRIGN